MGTKKKKAMILSSIKDDLIHSKLIISLSGIGLNADAYCQNLSSTVFDLMGLGSETNRNEEIFAGYIEHIKKVQHIDIVKYPEELDKLTQFIYQYLELKKG